MPEECSNCVYGAERNANPKTQNTITCRRYPKFEPKQPDDWCGEYDGVKRNGKPVVVLEAGIAL